MNNSFSRRRFVRTAVTATAGTLVRFEAQAGATRPVFQTVLGPEAAVNELIEGNRRFVTGNITAHEHDLRVLNAKTVDKQEPFAAVLSCADSRVPVEVVCGAVAATIKGSAVPGQISALYPRIRPAVDLAGPHTEAATKANARIQAALLAEASTVIGGLVKESKIKVVAGYYDVSSGMVSVLG